jgi:hypothetical protein
MKWSFEANVGGGNGGNRPSDCVQMFDPICGKGDVLHIRSAAFWKPAACVVLLCEPS